MENTKAATKVGDTVRVLECAGKSSAHVGKVGKVSGFSEHGYAIVDLEKDFEKGMCEAVRVEVLKPGTISEQKVGNKVSVVACSKGNKGHVGMVGEVSHLNPSGRVVVKNNYAKCVATKVNLIEKAKEVPLGFKVGYRVRVLNSACGEARTHRNHSGTVIEVGTDFTGKKYRVKCDAGGVFWTKDLEDNSKANQKPVDPVKKVRGVLVDNGTVQWWNHVEIVPDKQDAVSEKRKWSDNVSPPEGVDCPATETCHKVAWLRKAKRDAEIAIGRASDKYNAEVRRLNQKIVELEKSDHDRIAKRVVVSEKKFDDELVSSGITNEHSNEIDQVGTRTGGKFCSSCGAPYDSSEVSTPRSKAVRRFKPRWVCGEVLSLAILASGSLVTGVLAVTDLGLRSEIGTPVLWFMLGVLLISCFAFFFVSIREGSWVTVNIVPRSEKRRCSLAGRLRDARTDIEMLEQKASRLEARVADKDCEMAALKQGYENLKASCRTEVDRVVNMANIRLDKASKETIPLSRAIKVDQMARVAIGHNDTYTFATPNTRNEAIIADGKPRSKVVATFSWLDDHEVKPDELVLFKKESMQQKK